MAKLHWPNDILCKQNLPKKHYTYHNDISTNYIFSNDIGLNDILPNKINQKYFAL